MAEPSDAYRYISYLASRWRFIAVSCAVAVALAVAFSLTRPQNYTAICQVLIEPPPGGDLRAAFAVNPIYLESLKTYEHFAASDSLFLQALDQFHLRQRFPHAPVESLKSRILKVVMVPYTRILQIQVTLPDAKIAHSLAVYLGEETVKMNRSLSSQGDQEFLQRLQGQEAEARDRLADSERAWTRLLAQQPIDRLQQEIRSSAELRSALERQLLGAEEDAADPEARDAAGVRARAVTLRKQVSDVERDIAAKEELWARRIADRDRLEAERKNRQEEYAAVQGRVRQARAEVGARGEQLRIIDPGIVPERPSSPNLLLALLAALLLGMVAPVIYLTLALSYQTQRSSVRRSALRVAGTGSDE